MKLWGLVDGEMKDLRAEIAQLKAEIELMRGYRDAAESDAAIARLLVDKLRLTDEEREAIASCVNDDEAATAYNRAAVLRGLLERLT